MDKNGFFYPPVQFNLVYSLLHIFNHVFNEGVGLRQVMDYYFILRNATAQEKESAMEVLRWMGLERFVGALTYVERTIFMVPDTELLCPPAENTGSFLLQQIFEGGNFGKYDERIKKAHTVGIFHRFLIKLKRLSGMISFFPSEVLWAPVFKPIHFFWRAMHGYLDAKKL